MTFAASEGAGRQSGNYWSHEALVDTVRRAQVDAGLLISTSRVNYVDPRIAVAFCKRCGLPPTVALGGEQSALYKRLAWALNTPAGFRWDAPAKGA